LCGPANRICYVPVISDGKSEAAASWIGARGFVHEAVSSRLGAAAGSYEYYLAGPPPMVEAARRMLVLEKSVPVEQVHYDRFY
jgi:toluene monooxygenase electron transfer component